MAQYNSTAARFPQAPQGPQRGASGFPWLLLLFSIILFVFSLVIYGGLQGYLTVINNQVNDTETQLSDLQKRVDAGSQRKYLDYYSQIANMQKILKSHTELSKFFDKLQAATNKRVKYKSVSINVKRNEIIIQGVAENYDRLAEQLESFRRTPGVTQIILQSSKAADNKIVDFTVSVTVSAATLQ